ncbi:peptidase M4 [Streptomyces pluripotens]|uniref:Neutral metalloproteinase n=1 Tax=Streptomyces pluripotens TaxID=1355015 RepID=A0A221P3N6_9ACTN|nr:MULTISPECIES: M4 family metallopeptidase [Streptomyces]ARP72437.1 peptidase M4 [Streptomyces pluripotens]ASN26686.1 peptidase M4 [Streptomyces pluripotens]KIE26140.1 peptidase M4 [Streptomyces sp. MUSC 125]MCH0559599.1 M4 family metallopeptidase [Streptomyces sp. MUM 16J]
MRSNSSRGRTSHTPHRTIRHRRTATVALAGVAALIAAAVQTGVASAAPAKPQAGKANPAHMALKLTPSQRAELIRDADAAKAATARSIGLGSKEKLVVRDVVKDANGTLHTRYERTYAGLPVLGGDLVVDSSKAGVTMDVIKATDARLKVTHLTPAVSKTAAEKQGVRSAKALGGTKSAADSVRKVIWAANGKPVLAYETVIGGLQDDGTPNQLHVITDAATGKKLHEYQGIQTGIGNTQYSGQVSLTTAHSGSTYTLTDNTRGGHKTYNLNHGSSGTGSLFSQSSDTWGNGSTSNAATAGADAAYGAQETWDFYKNTFNRSGIRDDGVGAYSRVHYGNSYVNAFWDDSCFCMTYGDGSGNADPLTSLDVAGHEMSHGVTSNTAGLNYSGESGGLNEATSDIMGTGVEFYAHNASDPGDYLIGEKININGDGTPLRYMDKPSKDGNSADSWYSGVGNLNVHYSSGVANHFFYLLSEGSGAKVINGVSYNSPTSDGLPVTGIGRDKALQIWYRALTTKWTSTTNYAGARSGTLAAAGELYGTSSAAYKAVQDAWAAVNVGSRSGGGGGGGTSYENDNPVSIPDDGPAVTSSITVSGRSGNAPSNLKVGVDITHTWRGDLVIDLIGPSGTAYRLKNFSSSDSADNVNETYTVNASAEPANGTWKLRVQDQAAWDTGTLNDWKLTFP